MDMEILFIFYYKKEKTALVKWKLHLGHKQPHYDTNVKGSVMLLSPGSN